MHIHISALDALIVWAYMIIGMFFLRLVATKYPDNSFSKALFFVH